MSSKMKLPSGENARRKIIIKKGSKKAKRSFICCSKNCGFTTSVYSELCDHRHKTHYCDSCNCKCMNKATHKCRKEKEPLPLPSIDVNDTIFKENAKALNGATLTLVHDFSVHVINLRDAIDLVYDDLFKLLQKYVHALKGIRVKFTFKLDVTEIKSGQRRSRFYQSPFTRITHQAFISEVVLANLDYISKTIQMLTEGGSGIKIEGVQSLQVDIVAYQSVYPRGKSNLPPELKGRRGLLNIKTDKNCFKYCILAALYGDGIHLKNYPGKTMTELKGAQKCHLREKMECARNYKPIIKMVDEQKLLDFTGFEDTFDINEIGKFEGKNKVSITLYELDKETKNVKACRYTEKKYDRHVNLLLTGEGKQAHLILIRDISKFFGMDGYHKVKICPHCGLRYHKQRHLNECRVIAETGFRFLSESNKFFKFKDFKKLLSPPYRMYTDLLYIQSGSTFDVAGYGIIALGPMGEIAFSDFFIGPDPMEKYLDIVFKLTKIFVKSVKCNQLPLPTMTSEEQKDFDEKTHCLACSEPFVGWNPKTRHHNHHKKDVPIQAVCQRCNLQIKDTGYIPMISHSHQRLGHQMIIQNLSSKHTNRVYIVPKSNESFTSITFDGTLRLLDGRSLLDFPLQDMVKWHLDAGNKKIFERFYSSLLPQALQQPFYFPHTYFTSTEKLDEEGLPPLSNYVDILLERQIGQKEYEEMQKMYTLTSCSSFRDFCMVYLQSRVYQLACVMEDFDDWGMKTFQLSPLQDISLASFGYSAATFHSKAPFEIPIDPKIVNLIMQNIRGGISHLSKRVLTAKSERLGHKNVKDF